MHPSVRGHSLWRVIDCQTSSVVVAQKRSPVRLCAEKVDRMLSSLLYHVFNFIHPPAPSVTPLYMMKETGSREMYSIT